MMRKYPYDKLMIIGQDLVYMSRNYQNSTPWCMYTNIQFDFRKYMFAVLSNIILLEKWNSQENYEKTYLPPLK